MVSFNVPRREGLKNIAVDEEVEFTLSFYNFNKFGKKQFSGCVIARHREKMAFSIGRMPYNEQTVAKQLQFA